MSSLLTVLFQRNIFYFHLVPLVFLHCQIYIFNVALVVVVAVAVLEAAVGNVELQRETFTVSSVELQRGSLPNAERSNS